MKQIAVVSTNEDGMSLVLNVGSVDSISAGQRFLIYGEGDELFDPITKESLGRLEIVRGTGKAVHVQERMTTVRSDAKSEASRTIRKRRHDTSPFGMTSLSGFLGLDELEEIIPKDSLPFDGAEKGDKARPI